MDSFALQRLEQDPDWRLLLAAYAAAEPEPARAVVSSNDEADDETETVVDESSGWLPRVDDLPDVAREHLPRLHGRLIAFGLLKFQLTSATTGVVYRVTPKGRAMLESQPATGEDESIAA